MIVIPLIQEKIAAAHVVRASIIDYFKLYKYSFKSRWENEYHIASTVFYWKIGILVKCSLSQ